MPNRNIENPRAWKWALREATKDKAWAVQKKGDLNWQRNASTISNEMLHGRLTKSKEQLAKESYDYLKFRANAKGTLYGRPSYIDESARKKWLDFKNRKPVSVKKSRTGTKAHRRRKPRRSSV